MCRRMGVTDDDRTRTADHDVAMGADGANQCGIFAVDEHCA